MANNKKTTDNASENKVVTKYDLKVQRRKEEKERAKKEQIRNTILGVLAVVLVFAFFISFPIRNWLTLNGTYVEIAGEKVNQIEFDYQFNMIKNNYINQNSYLLSYFGMDPEGDLSTQMYSGDLSWQDYFEQATVQGITQNKLLVQEAKAKGFEYDVTEDYNEYLETLKTAAETAGITEVAYIQQNFGVYATIERLEDAIKEALHANAYLQQVAEDVYPEKAAVDAEYEANKEEYDSVDYRITIISAELPTAPTELADPVEETAEDSAAAEGEETAYKPSQAEIDKAMADAKVKADEALTKISTEGTLSENVLRNSATSTIRFWLFDEERAKGETTIIEDDETYKYYVLEFLDRYRDETPSADIRVIVTDKGDGQAILDEWKAGAATEDSFKEMADTRSTDTTADGGLYEGVLPTSGVEALDTWVSAKHEYGETAVIDLGENVQYVMFYVGENSPNWQLTIESALLDANVTTYLSDLTKDAEVVDKKGNLNYIKIQESLEAAQEESSDEATVEVTPAE